MNIQVNDEIDLSLFLIRKGELVKDAVERKAKILRIMYHLDFESNYGVVAIERDGTIWVIDANDCHKRGRE